MHKHLPIDVRSHPFYYVYTERSNQLEHIVNSMKYDMILLNVSLIFFNVYSFFVYFNLFIKLELVYSSVLKETWNIVLFAILNPFGKYE